MSGMPRPHGAGISVALYIIAMKNILLCSSDPILIKNLYATLRDEGYAVETVEHPARAVQAVMAGMHDALVVDSDPFGLSVDDAVEIIHSVRPEFPVLRLGEGHAAPADLESLKRTIYGIAV